MTDPLSELRTIRDDALARRTGDPLVDDYESDAVAIAWNDLTGEDAGALADTLTVEFPEAGYLGAYVIGSVASALQNATVKVDRQLLSPGTTNLAVSGHDRRRVEIVQEAQYGNKVIFRVPALAPTGAGDTTQLSVPTYSGRAGRALNELVNYLPQSRDDDAAVRGILGSAPAIRSAVGDILKASRHTPDGVGLSLTSGSSTIGSIIRKDTAEDLYNQLTDPEIVEEREPVIGYLDGMRGERRVVYIVGDDGREYEASAPSEMVNMVADGMYHQRVFAVLISSRWRKKNGRLGEKSYRLDSLGEAPEQTTIDD